jgi:hypothetical protein
MSRTHTSKQKHTPQRATKILRIAEQTHRDLKLVALLRRTTMADLIRSFVEDARKSEMRKVERNLVKRYAKTNNQPTAQVA